MPIRTKRWDDPKDPADGFRLLVCHYRPRGLPRDQQTWDDWDINLSPSKELHAAAYGKNGQIRIAWESYRRAFLQEMLRQKPALKKLAARSLAGETITLLCSSACAREHRCHRSLLRDLINAEADSQKKIPDD